MAVFHREKYSSTGMSSKRASRFTPTTKRFPTFFGTILSSSSNPLSVGLLICNANDYFANAVWPVVSYRTDCPDYLFYQVVVDISLVGEIDVSLLELVVGKLNL